MPGSRSAQRYRLELAVEEADTTFPFRHLVVYEVDGDMAALVGAMSEANLDDADSYADRKQVDEDGPPLPAWWDRGALRFVQLHRRGGSP